MSEVPLYGGEADFLTCSCVAYRGSSFIRNCPPPQDFHRALGIVLL